MSGLFDQITNYSPPLLTAGQVNYKGTWDAAANSPTLTSPPASTSKGDYYVVSTAGTQFSISFAVGDWIISNGTAWEKVDLTDAVSSVFGRTGAVVGVSTDYSAVGITNTAIGASSPSTGAFTTITATSTITATGAVTGSNLSGTNTGNQTISITGDVTAAGSTGVLTASVTRINGTSLAGLATGILKNTTTTGVPSIAVAADFPTLNQSTTGSAATLTTPRAIYGNNFDGSAALTQVIAGTYGGTGVNNGANTITIAGNVTHAGAFTQSFTATANTALTLPTTGTLATLAGSEALSNKTITASAFNGTVGATTPSTGAFTTLSASTYVQATGGGNDVSKLYSSGTLSTLQLGSPTEAVGGLKYERSTGAISVFNGTQASQTTIALFSSTGLGVTGALSVSGAALTLGTNSGSGTSRRVFDIEAGGYAAPGAFNTDSNGDKINFFKGGSGLSYDARIGIGTTSNLWYRSSGSTSGVGVHEFYVGSTPTLIQTISSTGLAVTGALSATGNLTLSAANPSLIGGTNAGSVSIQNPDAGAYITIYGSAHATKANKVEIIGTGGVTLTNGLAVTGALSLTGAITISGSPFGQGAGVRYISGAATSTDLYSNAATGGVHYWAIGESIKATLTGTGLGIGTTSPSSSKLVIESDGTTFGTYGSTINLTAASGTRYHILFRENGTERGSITSNGITVAYNSVSDYRLKDITGSLTDSGTFIDALKPKVGTWKSDGSKFVGFLAHEFAEVSPSSVSGEKDAVDADGNPKYQGMQAGTAEVIANLVAELQSLRQRVAALESN